MTIHNDNLHLLIYAAETAYLLASACFVARSILRPIGKGGTTGKAGETLFALGFAILIAAFVLRWRQVGHVPMQSLFEIFLTLGMVIYPLSLFCRKVLAIDSPAVDAAIGLIVLVPAGLFFKSDPQHLPPALQSRLFIPHVASYILAYILLAMATAQANFAIFSRSAENTLRREASAHRLVRLGFPLLTAGLVLGAWWGERAWGDYWHWDPKELWSLATWLIFLGYLHFRRAAGVRQPRLNAFLVVSGGLAVIITLLWVNLSRLFPGLHNYATS